VHPESQLLLKLQQRSFTEEAHCINDWKRFFKIASINRVLYDSIQKLYPLADDLHLNRTDRFRFDSLKKQSDIQYQRTQRTYALWKETAEKHKVDYRIFKTHKSIFEIPNDIDILVPEDAYPHISRALSQHVHTVGVTRANQIHLKYNDFIHLDLHAPTGKSVLVNGTQTFSGDLAWENPEEFHFEGESYLKPSATADAGLTLLNSMFGHFHLSWNEIYTFRQNIKRIELLTLSEQARLGRWEKVLSIYLNYIDRVEEVYPILLSFKDLITLYREKRKAPLGITSLDRFNAFYLLYAKARYYFTEGTRVPIHGHWCGGL
jgi:hypothetical protein